MFDQDPRPAGGVGAASASARTAKAKGRRRGRPNRATATLADSQGCTSGETEQGEAPHPEASLSSRRVGRYRILRKMGEGGFGEVYLAVQEEPVVRKVALKIVKAGMGSREVIERFELERRAIGMMDHPNIAKVLDAGTTEAGLPYFVMDLVVGLPITDFCDRRRLSIRDRLRLFVEVCRAVQHAHQKGIIHRDIKPSNVMVTTTDSEPLVKVIDFGVAKATQDAGSPRAECTSVAQFIGTPDYMSPEQAARSRFVDIDTRSDIYSLGVLLHRLMVGIEPFSADALLAAGCDEMCRTIREVEPRRPSARIAELAPDEARRLAQWRGVDWGEWRRRIRGDLDRIILKAIDKDRERRYETANGLALDIERHLKNEPVRAVAPSAAYLLRKFLKRNRAAVVVATCVAAILISAVLAAIDLAMGAKRAALRADRAETRADKARSTLNETRGRLDDELLVIETMKERLNQEIGETRALSNALGSASAGHWRLSAGDGQVAWDERMAAALYGEAVPGRGDLGVMLAAIEPEDRAPLQRLLEAGLSNGTMFRAVVRAARPGGGGEPRFLRIFGGPGHDGGLRGICIPIAEIDYDATRSPYHPGPGASGSGSDWKQREAPGGE